jgi:hypothetical protein
MTFRLTRKSRSMLALTLASAGLSACSSAPTAPSSLSGTDAAPTLSTASQATASAGVAQSHGVRTIKITDGTLSLQSGQPGTVTLKGSHGFRFEGRTLSGVEPALFCGALDPCFPGATVAFNATWLGTDLPGMVRLQGQEFEVGTLETPGLYIDMTGSFVAPPHLTDTISLTVPFSLTGLVAGEPLTGGGDVTLTLEWQPFLNGWGITNATFDFGPGPGSD